MPEHKPAQGATAEDDFAALFEQSSQQPVPGEVVSGRVVQVGRDSVTIDIGYKCEGQVPIHEFRTRDGELAVGEGDVVDVYFESTDSEPHQTQARTSHLPWSQ